MNTEITIEACALAALRGPAMHPTCDQMDRDLEEIRLELEAEARAKEMAAARAASPSGGRVAWCQWCACFEDDPRCHCLTCAHCGATALEGEAEGWRCLTCHDATHQMICPGCLRDLEGEDRNPIP